MQTLKVKWQVSLSDGTTVYEGKGDYLYIAGELSPWNRLLEHIKTNELRITSLSLYTDKGQTFNLPSAGKNPKFHLFASSPQPIGYKMFRAVGHDIDAQSEDHFTVAEADYGDYRLQLWVDNQHPENCWTLLVKE